MIDLNELLITGLSKEIGYPVAQDLYTPPTKEKASDIFAEFTYADERPVLWGNDKPVMDNTQIQLKLTTPRGVDYFPIKRKIVKFLEKQEILVNNNYSYLEAAYDNKVRCTIFEISVNSFHEDNEED